MKLLYEKEKPIYEMANIRPDETNLPMVIWIFPKTGKEKHSARIKVSKKYGEKASDDMFTITIPDYEIIGDTGNIKKQDIEKVIAFVKLNEQVILQVWEDKISPAKAVSLFKKL